jgi:hypothetical protein
MPLTDDGINAMGPSEPEDLDALTVPELQARLRADGLPVSGTKPELVARLRGGSDR